MTLVTVDERASGHPEGDLIADVVARMCETTDRLRSEYRWDDEPLLGWLALLIADSQLLAQLMPVRSALTVERDPASRRALLEDVIGRLWMVAR